jgi:putative heme-binding domain-containing protein
MAAATALLALSRTGTRFLQPRLLEKAEALLADESLTREQRVIVLRSLVLCFCRMFRPFDREVEARVTRRLESLYPAESYPENHFLCQLLVYLESPQVIEKTLPLIESAATQEEKLHYLVTLRTVEDGWTLPQRSQYFQWLRRAREFDGARYMPQFLTHITDDAAATLSVDERAELAPLLEAEAPPVAPDGNTLQSVQRPFVRKWSVADLLDDLERIGHDRDYERGRDLFVAVQCSQCHRLGEVGKPVGPDLKEVARRFSRKDMLTALIEPSKVVPEKFRNEAIVTTAGKVVIGRVLGDDGQSVIVEPDPLDPGRTVEIPVGEIETRQASLVSPMPSGLLDTMQEDEVLDLLAYLETGGDADAENFQVGESP